MTPDNVKHRRLVGLFILGWVLNNYPILSLFNLPSSFFGIPILYCYIFAAWAMIIIGVIFMTRFGNQSGKTGS